VGRLIRQETGGTPVQLRTTAPRWDPSAGDRAGAGDRQCPPPAGSKRSTGEVEARASGLVVRTQPSQAMRLRSRKVGVSGRPIVVKNGSWTGILPIPVFRSWTGILPVPVCRSWTGISLDLARDPELRQESRVHLGPVEGLPVTSKIQSKMGVPPVCRGRAGTPLRNHAFQWQ